MGVINNLIEIRRKFRAIVGANWDGMTIADIKEVRPDFMIELQPSDTDANSIQVRVNLTGVIWNLYRKVDNNWSYVTTSFSAYSNPTIPLTAIAETSVCRIGFYVLGTDRNLIYYSNEFTVTRTAAQTASLKAGSKSKGEDIFTESEVDSIDVVKENIEKE